MRNKIWIVNIALAVLIIIFGLEAYRVWSEDPTDLSAVEAPGKPEVRPAMRIDSISMPRESFFGDIVEKNLFSSIRSSEREEREVGLVTAEPEVKEVKIGGKDILLYGVVLAGNYKKALITNVGKNNKKEGPATWVSIGDDLGDGFVVADIKEESIIFEKGDARYETPLYDEKKDRQIAVSRSRERAKEEVKPTIVTADSAQDDSPQKPGSVGGVDKADKAEEAPEQEKKDNAVSTDSEDAEYIIIDTPFGKIKRRKK